MWKSVTQWTNNKANWKKKQKNRDSVHSVAMVYIKVIGCSFSGLSILNSVSHRESSAEEEKKCCKMNLHKINWLCVYFWTAISFFLWAIFLLCAFAIRFPVFSSFPIETLYQRKCNTQLTHWNLEWDDNICLMMVFFFYSLPLLLLYLNNIFLCFIVVYLCLILSCLYCRSTVSCVFFYIGC